MATRRWLGNAKQVAQIDTIVAGGTISGETFSVLVNGIVVATFIDTDTVANTVRDGIVAAWNASTHPYCTNVTAAATATTGELSLTGDDSMPFTVTVNTPGGTATWVLSAEDTVATGPNFFDDADNWTGNTVPVSADDVIFEKSSVSVCWNISQTALELANIHRMASYTGRIGLRKDQVATSADGGTTSAVGVEYRETYLDLDHFDRLEIGEKRGPGAVAGVGRINIANNKAELSNTVIHSTPRTSSDGAGTPVCLLKYNHANADIVIKSAPGGVGIAVGSREETSTIGDVLVSDPSTESKVFIGSGVTLTSFKQLGGTNTLSSANTPTTVSAKAGVLNLEGASAIGTLNADGAIINDARAANITTVNLNAGTLDATTSQEAKTYTTVNHESGAILVADENLTITNYGFPSKKVTLEMSE